MGPRFAEVKTAFGRANNVIAKNRWLFLAITIFVVAKYMLVVTHIRTNASRIFLGVIFLSWLSTMLCQIIITTAAFFTEKNSNQGTLAVIRKSTSGLWTFASLLVFAFGAGATIGNELIFASVTMLGISMKVAHYSPYIAAATIFLFITLVSSILPFVWPTAIIDDRENPFEVSLRLAKPRFLAFWGINVIWYGWIAISAIVEAHDDDGITHLFRVLCPIIGTAMWLFWTVFITVTYSDLRRHELGFQESAFD